MSKKILFEEIQTKLTSQGFFMVRDALQLFQDYQAKWQKCIQEFMMTYHEAQMERFVLLCDFVVETKQQIIIGIASLSELESGKLESDDSTIAFSQNEVKQKHLICIMSDKVPLSAVLDEMRKRKIKKSRKYKNKLSNTILQSQAQTKRQNQEQQQKPRLPKKTLRKVNEQPMQIQIIEKAPKRRLMLRSSQSESEHVHSKGKLESQIALFSMKSYPHNQQPSKVEIHEQEMLVPLKQIIKSQIPQNSLRESKLGKSNSQDMGKKNQSKKDGHLKPLSKKQSKKQEVQKQSVFMSNWIKKSK